MCLGEWCIRLFGHIQHELCLQGVGQLRRVKCGVDSYSGKQICIYLDNRLRSRPSLHELGSENIYLPEFWVPTHEFDDKL